MSNAERKLLTEGVLDVYFLFKVIRRLTTPFNKWPAYNLGIIDERGNVLKPRKTLITKEERDAFTVFDVFVKNIKRVLEKVPGGKSVLGSYVAGLFLIKEGEKPQDENEDLVYESFMDFFESVFTDHVEEAKESFRKYLLMTKQDDTMEEDAPANSVAGGGVAGLTEPIVRKRKQFETKESNL